MDLNSELKTYIKGTIFPEYAKNEPAHGLEHIKYVIDRSFKFAGTVPDINYNIVYAVAAYHDLGHHIDPGTHEQRSAEIMFDDERLKDFFTDQERQTIREAIEDHRASSDHEPRSVYGKIVSTADRNHTVKSCLSRSYSYNKNLHPGYDDREIFEDCYAHLNDKFGENGYAKFFFEDVDYEKFLKDIRELLSDKEKFIETQENYIAELKANGAVL